MIVYCPHCNQKYEVDENLFGQNVSCSTCQKDFIVESKKVSPQKSENETKPNKSNSLWLFFFIGAVIIALVFLITTLLSNKKIDELKTENNALRQEIIGLKKMIDDIKLGPEKMLAEALAFVESSNFDKAKEILDSLFQRHPSKKIEAKYKEVYQAVNASILARNRKIAEDKARIEAALLANIEKKYDQMQSITWYETKRDCEYAVSMWKSSYSSSSYADESYSVEPYLGQRDNGTLLLRLRTRYYNSKKSRTWVFYEKVQLKGSNGINVYLETKYPEKESESGDGSLREWSDNNVNEIKNELIRLAEAEKIFVKFYGKYSYEFEMTSDQLAAFKEIMAQYKNMGK